VVIILSESAAMSENEQCWTGVILKYVCPNCRRPDRQMFVFAEGTYDNAVLSKAAAHMIPCRACNAPLPKDDLTLETDICVATLEQLRKAGYPTPPVN
jgi:hypothetical protein